MSELQWDVLAEIYLKREDWSQEIVCLCSRVFTSSRNPKKNISLESGASEDDAQFQPDANKSTSELVAVKSLARTENEHETVSCYCSASHTDNFSTDEHDSLRDIHDVSLIKQSDSGADLSEHSKYDIEADWHIYWSLNGEKLIWESWIEKYSAYINPDYLQAQTLSTTLEEKLQLQDTQKLPKVTKFPFDASELDCGKHSQLECYRKDDIKNRVLHRNLSGSDEKLFTEVSEGWNPLSPLSLDGETEAERLLSSRCGSHASGSIRTIDSMTNVTRMTVSSIDLSCSTSSSDSFSSVSSVISSACSEDLEEDYQQQWNNLWKKHYEEEYAIQYNNFIKSIIDSYSPESTETLKSSTDTMILKNQYFNSVSTSKLCLKNADSNKPIYSNSESEPIRSLGQLNLNMSNEGEFSSDSHGANYKCNIEEAEMSAMGLPVAFGSNSNLKNDSNSSKKLNRSDSFNAGRNRIKAAFNVLGIEFKDEAEPMTGHVDYKMKHIRLQNRHLKMTSDNKRPKHIHFDEDGNVSELGTNYNQEEESLCPSQTDDSDDYLSSGDDDTVLSEVVTPSKEDEKSEVVPVSKRKKRKKKSHLPPEIKENSNLRKFWRRRFSLFSKFDLGIRLDEESWYSVTPEQVAKNAARKCRCNLLIDAFCGAGGNSIQFAKTCDRVIAVDIDPKKIEMARNNAKVYGVAEKIEFIVGDFFKLADTLKGDVLFASPPWGGPTYVKKSVYDLETMLQPVPLSQLLVACRKITQNIGLFLPKNSNTNYLINEAKQSGKVEIEQDFLNNKLIAITAYYGNLVKCNDNQ